MSKIQVRRGSENLKFLKKKREGLKLTRDQLGKKLQVSGTTVTNWEEAQVIISEQSKKKIQEFYKFDTGEQKKFQNFLQAVERLHVRQGKRILHKGAEKPTKSSKKKARARKSSKGLSLSSLLATEPTISRELVEKLKALALQCEAILRISGGRPVSIKDAIALL